MLSLSCTISLSVPKFPLATGELLPTNYPKLPDRSLSRLAVRKCAKPQETQFAFRRRRGSPAAALRADRC